ncbi:MAG: metallophosphoesterase [Phycisphaerales bacterium]|nr:metallophosphoesterase [Phycisphaerales bacterium]
MDLDRPILVISDLHLGRAGMLEAASMIQPLIDQAGTLIINGDTAELHVAQFRDQARRELDELRKRCDASNTRLHLLAGNHDPDLVPDRYLQLSAQRIFITHGDVIDEAVAPWSDAARRMRRQHRAFLEDLPPAIHDTLEGRFAACRSAAMAEWSPQGDAGRPSTPLRMLFKPGKIAKVLWFWATCNTRTNAFVEQFAPETRLILTGHSHRSGIFRRGDRTIVNTGSFGFPGRPLGVVLDQTGASVHKIIQRDGCWDLVEKPIYTDPSVPIESSSDEAASLSTFRTTDAAPRTAV